MNTHTLWLAPQAPAADHSPSLSRHLPTTAQVRHLRARGPAAAPTLRQAPRQGTEAVVLQDALLGADLLALFEAVDELQEERPLQLVVDDLFCVHRLPSSSLGAPSLEHVRALLLRMGWQLVHEETGPSHACDAGGQGAGCARAVLVLHRDQRPAERLVRVEESRREAMRALFQDVFQESMSLERWQWKYGQGRGRAVGLWSGDRLVAHYGGFTRPVMLRGRRERACQVGDVMVLPSANRSLSRNGPMYQIGATFAAFEVGYGLPDLIGYGFPNRRAFTVAKRLGLYDKVDEIVEAHWQPLQGPAALRSRAEPLDGARVQGAAMGRTLDRLWSAMAAALGESVVLVRDASWLRHRYFAHPDLRYEVLLLRSPWLRRPVGLLVMRRHEQHLSILDLVGDPRHFPALVALARECAAHWGLNLVTCWITRSHAGHLAGPGAEPALIDIGVEVPNTVHTEGPPLEALRGRWWLTSGDADFT